MSESSPTTPADRVNGLYSVLQSWRKVGLELEISGAMAHRVAHGYEPKDPGIRKKLGFPAIEYIPQVRNSSGRFAPKKIS